MAKRKTCGDCGTKEGQLHILGCDMEGCPFCGNQLISCQCGYKKLGIDVSPGSWAYSHGLTEAQQEDWEKLLSDKGRIHVSAAALRLNKSIALSRIEPFHRAARHCRSPN